jgi:mannosyltransferase
MARIFDRRLDFGAVAAVRDARRDHGQTDAAPAWVASAAAHDVSRGKTALILAGTLALAVTLDGFGLGTRSLWPDESVSVALASLDWRGLSHALRSGEANMALYYGLLHEWLALGRSEFAVRAFSALASIAAITAVFVLGKRLFDNRVGLLAGFFLAINSFQIRYAQEARSYSLVILLVLLASLAFLEAMAKPTRRRWAVYALTGALAVYAHFFTLLVLVAHWASALLWARGRGVARPGIILSAAAVGLLVSPLAVVAAAGDTSVVDWIPKPNARAVSDLACALTGASPWSYGCPHWGSRLFVAPYVVACLLALAATGGAFKRAWTSFEGWRYGFLWTWGLLPIAFVLSVSPIKSFLISRYFVVCLPPLVLLASAGIARLRPSFLLVLAIGAFVVAAGYQDVRFYYARLGQKDWRAATIYLASHSQPNDAVVFSPLWLVQPYDYYRGRLSERQGPTVVRGEPTDELLTGLPAHYSRVWLLYDYDSGYPLNSHVTAYLGSVYPSRQNVDFAGLRITLYTRP